MIKVQFQYKKDTHSRSNNQKRRSSNGKQQNQGSQRIENFYQSKESRKLFKVCKFYQ